MASCLTVWKGLLEQHGITSTMFLKYASIPVVSTLFTYFHIWAALYMTFYPLNFAGCLQIPDTNVGCGWQGIVPSKAAKMATTSVQLMTTRIISVSDMFERIDPKKVSEELDPVLQGSLMNIIDAVAMQEEPELWAKLPHVVKDELIEKAREDTPAVIAAMMQDVKHNLDKVFDLSEMVVNALVRDPGLLNYMFINCGFKELAFIRDSGATMGFVFGMVQVILWIYWSAGWMLPTFGLVVGLLTNWIALKMIFEPVTPVPIFGGRIVLQGLFLKRQTEVSAEYARIVAGNVLSARNLIRAIVVGKCSDNLFALIQKHVRDACDRYMGISRPVLCLIKGKTKIEATKRLVGDGLMRSLPQTMRHVERYFDSAMDLENLLRSKMEALSSEDFETLLHPVFQEDEWKLILMGGVLGVVVGMFQWYALGS